MKCWIWALLFLINSNHLFACHLKWQQSKVDQKVFKNQAFQKISLDLIKGSSSSKCGNIAIKSESLTNSRSLNLESNQIPFSMFFDSNASRDYSLGQLYNIDSITSNLKENSSKTIELFIMFDDKMMSAFLKAGTYQYEEKILLYIDGRVVDSIFVNISLEIATEINLKLLKKGSNSGVGDSLKFNKMIEGEVVELDISMISNTGHSLWIESENNGHLTHEGLGEKISYKTYVNEQEIGSLEASKRKILSNSKQSSKAGDRLGLKFQINQPINNLPAGEYMDVIRINIQSEM